jgi:hypothetical protein
MLPLPFTLAYPFFGNGVRHHGQGGWWPKAACFEASSSGARSRGPLCVCRPLLDDLPQSGSRRVDSRQILILPPPKKSSWFLLFILFYFFDFRDTRGLHGTRQVVQRIILLPPSLPCFIYIYIFRPPLSTLVLTISLRRLWVIRDPSPNPYPNPNPDPYPNPRLAGSSSPSSLAATAFIASKEPSSRSFGLPRWA